LHKTEVLLRENAAMFELGLITENLFKQENQMDKIWYIIAIIVFTLLSGLGDSLGFVHSSKIWRTNGTVDWWQLLRAGLGFGFGILMYWLALRFLNQLKMLSTEVQSLGWFAVTMIGIAFFSGRIFKWQTVDIIIALLVFSGVGWLLYHTES
jgi:hypothetical protein